MSKGNVAEATRSIHDLVDLLRIDRTERHLHFLMSLQTYNYITLPANGYLDETEKDDIVGVGGWIGTYEKWHGFEERWRDILPKEANGDFHYTDFWHDPKYWSAQWSHEKRLEFILRLASIAIEHASMGIGIVISKTDYERNIPEEYKGEFKGAVYFCLGHCLRLLIEKFNHVPGQPPKPIRFMHDSKKGKQDWIADWYYTVRTKFEHLDILGELSFGPRSGEPVLQAADLLIGELRRYREGHPSRIIDMFREHNKVIIGRPNVQELRDLVKKTIENADN